MAENIVKLRVDGKDFDSNIKSARQGLLAMEQACRKVGGTFEVVEKEELDFVKALGKMETTSKSAKGKITELTSAFTDLKAQYNRLTDAEKQSQFGKALNQSLNELKGRINASNVELKNIQGELGGTSTSIESLTSKLGINIGTLAKFTTAGAAVSAAMQVCKDAFMSSETNVDNWGRTVEATKSVYESFCISLNNGSLDGWFSNMDRLIQKAKDAYNAIDELNTKMTIINPERVKVQGEIQKQKEIIRTKGKDSAEGKAAAAEIKRLEPKLKDTYKQEADMNFKAFRAEVDKKLTEAGINLDSKSKALLMRSFSDTKAYDQIAAGAKSETRGTGRYNLDENGHAIGPEITETWKNTNQKLLDLFTDEWRTKNSGYLTAGYNAKMQSANVGIQDARYTGAGSGSKSTKSEPMFDIKNLRGGLAESDALSYYQKQYENEAKQRNINGSFTDEALRQMEDLKNQLRAAAKIELQIELDPEAQVKLKAALEKVTKAEQLKQMDKQLQGISDNVNKAASSFGTLGSAMQMIEDPAVQVAGIVLEAIANVAASFARALRNARDPWEWIAAASSGTAVMISTIAAIKSATSQDTSGGKYAEGGLITGPSYVGDAVPIMANAGEVVLNASQQEMLAGNLQAAGGGGGSATTVVKGEQLITVINNRLRQTGKGDKLIGR